MFLISTFRKEKKIVGELLSCLWRTDCYSYKASVFIGIVYLVYACVYIGWCLCHTCEGDKVCLIGERAWCACERVTRSILS